MTTRNHDPMSSLAKAIWALVVVGFLLFLVLGALTVKAADELPGKPISTASEAVGWALADLAVLPELDRITTRYVWIPPWGDDKWVSAMDFAVNTAASHALVIKLGQPIANGWMIRYDLGQLAGGKQLDTLRSVWDGLASQDPYFHVPQVVSGVKQIVLAPHLQPQEAVALAGLSLSTGAIYRADWLLAKMLSTRQGGKYYDFLQIPRTATKEGLTPQQEWLLSLGYDEKASLQRNGIQRVITRRSGVTFNARRTDVFTGIGRNGPLAAITHDISDEDIEPNKHPLRNLLDFDDTGREIIVMKPNGTLAFALTNNQDQFVDFVPGNIAGDTTIPDPHSDRLQPARSCISCHGPFDGYQPVTNDVAKLITGRLDVFGDKSGKDLTPKQAVDILAGFYADDINAPDAPLGIARRKYSATCYRLFGPINPFTDNVATSPVQLISSKVTEIIHGYLYDPVTPERACLESGLLVEPGKGVAGLDHLLGERVPGTPADPLAGFLRDGLDINRSDFEYIAPDMALAVAVKHGYKPQQALSAPKEPAAEPPAVQPPPAEPAKAIVPPKPKPEPKVQAAPAVADTGAIETMFALHNAERAKRRGLQPLALADDLSVVAQAYAEVCFARGGISHDFDTRRYVKDRLRDAGVQFETAAENLAWAGAMKDEAAVMADWMASPGHRAAIIATYTDIGIGVKGPAHVCIFATRKR